MSAAERYITLNSRDLRLELEELYAAYTACLDEERFEEWPEFFVEQCLYMIVPRENFERGLPLATWLCESKGYLADRVTAIRKTAVYAPRYVRRMVSGVRVLGWKEEVLEVRANYVALETLQDELTRVFNTDRKSTRLNSSHITISYAVFCLKKKKTINNTLNILQKIYKETQ